MRTIDKPLENLILSLSKDEVFASQG